MVLGTLYICIYIIYIYIVYIICIELEHIFNDTDYINTGFLSTHKPTNTITIWTKALTLLD